MRYHTRCPTCPAVVALQEVESVELASYLFGTSSALEELELEFLLGGHRCNSLLGTVPRAAPRAATRGAKADAAAAAAPQRPQRRAKRRGPLRGLCGVARLGLSLPLVGCRVVRSVVWGITRATVAAGLCAFFPATTQLLVSL